MQHCSMVLNPLYQHIIIIIIIVVVVVNIIIVIKDVFECQKGSLVFLPGLRLRLALAGIGPFSSAVVIRKILFLV